MLGYFNESTSVSEKEKINFINYFIDAMQEKVTNKFSKHKMITLCNQNILKKWFYNDTVTEKISRHFVILSIKSDAPVLHCIYCVIFSDKNRNALCNVGVNLCDTETKRVENMLKSHEMTSYHNRSKDLYENASNGMNNNNIDQNYMKKCNIEKNRYVAGKVIQAVLYVTTSGKRSHIVVLF